MNSLPSLSPSLGPSWEGLYIVPLSTPSVVKIAGIDSWIHHIQVKAWKAEGAISNSREKQPRHQCEKGEGLKLKITRDK